MELKEILEKANLQIDKKNIYFSEPMKKHTTFKVGGLAECLIKIQTEKELKEILKLANENQIPITILGNGSNVLVSDKGIKGITLIIQIEKLEIKIKNEKVTVIVGAGEKMPKVARILAEKSISGLEELSGIPGTIGGLTRMNASAHGKEMKDIISKVKCIDNSGKEKNLANEQMEFGYRRSILNKEKYVVTEVEFKLQKGKKEEILKQIEEFTKYRKEKQPIEFPSAGSTFKRGDDFITAKLIDEAGLKGYTIGEAEISTKHAGFIINKGNATAKDILELAQYIEKEIYKKFGKKIELEIELIGEK